MRSGVFASLLLTISFLHCAKSEKPEEIRGMDEVFLNEFKLTYFKKLYSVGFNRPPQLDTILLLDHSHFTEPVLSSDDYRFIDSLVDLDNKWMISDSASSIGRVAEGGEGKHVLNYVLCKMAGTEIEELALKRYKIWEAAELKFLSMP